MSVETGFRVVLAARSIDRTSSDDDVDAEADRVEACLASARIQARSWLRELLFCLRNLEVDREFHALYLASVAAGEASGAYGPRAAAALRELATRRHARPAGPM